LPSVPDCVQKFGEDSGPWNYYCCNVETIQHPLPPRLLDEITKVSTLTNSVLEDALKALVKEDPAIANASIISAKRLVNDAERIAGKFHEYHLGPSSVVPSAWSWRVSNGSRNILRILRRWASISQQEDANSTKHRDLTKTNSLLFDSYLDRSSNSRLQHRSLAW